MIGKRNTIINDLECDQPSYIQLINLCFQYDITTPIIASFIRSISLHEFVDLQNIKLDEELDSSLLINQIQYNLDPK